MSERDVIAAARQIADPPERRAYLDRACADDVALRQRVEVLLGDNAGEPVKADVVSSEDVTAAIDTMGLSGPGGGEGNPLDFLQPPAMPGSLRRLGHYEVLEILGRGGFGIVLRAFDEVLRRVVAVKVMAPHIAAPSPARKRFLREARAALAHWQTGPDLAHIRDKAALDKLPLEERQACQRLWADVTELLKKADPAMPKR